MVMITVNIHEAKAKLSAFLEAVGRGERVVICNRNRPVAELVAVASAPAAQRRLGAAAGKVVIPSSFFDPLPSDMLDAFEGQPSDRLASRVAETKASYRGKPRDRR